MDGILERCGSCELALVEQVHVEQNPVDFDKRKGPGRAVFGDEVTKFHNARLVLFVSARR